MDVAVSLGLFLAALALAWQGLALAAARESMHPARLAAQRRSEALLSEFLSTGELRQLRSRGYLEVPSPRRPGRIYRVPAHHGPVAIYQNGRCVQLLCIGPVNPLPDGDVVLAHKLMIEHCEEEYVRAANPILNE